MKKIYLITFCLFVFASINAQKYYIQDSSIRQLFKSIANGSGSGAIPWPPYNGAISTCPTCFVGDSLVTTDFLNYTSDAWNVQFLSTLSISGLHIKSLEPFIYFGWGKTEGLVVSGSSGITYNHYGVLEFLCNDNQITDLSPIAGVPFYTFECRNNLITGAIATPYNDRDACMAFFLGSPIECSHYDYSYNQITSATVTQNYLGKALNLSHNNLTSVIFPSSTSYGYDSVDLSYNKFTSFVGNLPEAQDVPYINFSHNPSLTTVSPYIQYSCGRLNFSHCNISFADFGCCTPNKIIRELDLSYNNLTQLPEIAPYLQTANLYSLNLSHNNIKSFQFYTKDTLGGPTIPRYYFDNVKDLQYLDISHNGTNNIIGDFTPDLYTLKMDSNNLYCLPKLPQSLGYLFFDTSKITCLPNVGSFKINNTGSNIYATCNPLNNINQCEAFPTVLGRIYLDVNKNNVKDSADVWLSNIEVNLKTSNNKSFKTFTNNDGYYNVSGDTIGNYTIYIKAPPFHTSLPDSITGIFTQFDSTYLQDNTIIQFTNVFDSIVTYTNLWNGIRPGFNFEVNTRTINFGSTTLSPTIVIKFDPNKVEYVGSLCGGIFNGVDAVTINSTSLTSNNYFDCYTNLKVKPTATIGDSITIEVTTTFNGKTITDISRSVITGSYDPNDKNATPLITPTQVATGKYIDYTIHFQNTGNDTAFNIVVADTLSNLLQVNSLQVVTSSHNCKTTLTGNKIYFEFRNILLPDSNVNQLGSNGFVRFRVKPVNTLVLGNIVPNKASIYFDYNTPILTNTATTTVSNVIITPVRITNYELRITREKEILNTWTTSTEINTSHFNIQRSEDGRLFKTVGRVAAKSVSSYSFLDVLPTNYSLLTAIYYRLQAVDKDGQTSYSEVKRVTLNEKQETRNIVLYPNPTKDNLTIESKGIKKVIITDCFGRTVMQLNNIAEHQTINTKQWNKGIYIVSFDNGEKVKVVKE